MFLTGPQLFFRMSSMWFDISSWVRLYCAFLVGIKVTCSPQYILSGGGRCWFVPFPVVLIGCSVKVVSARCLHYKLIVDVLQPKTRPGNTAVADQRGVSWLAARRQRPQCEGCALCNDWSWSGLALCSGSWGRSVAFFYRVALRKQTVSLLTMLVICI